MGANMSVNMDTNASTTASTMASTAGAATMGASTSESAGAAREMVPQTKPAKEKVTGKSAKFTSIRTTMMEEEMTANGVPRENPFIVDGPKTNKVVKVRKKE